MGEAAAKESSMEDILSSIRKIISDDDNNSGDSAGTVEMEKPQAQPEAVVSSPEPTSPEPSTSAKSDAPSLADIAANVKAGVLTPPSKPTPEAAAPKETAVPQVEVRSEQAAPAPEGSGLKLSEIVAKMSAFKGESEEQAKLAAEELPAPTETVKVVKQEAAPEPVAEPEPAIIEAKTEVTEVKPEPVSEPSKTETEEFKTALMSPSSDDAVAGSFDRLKRSAMDDMDAKTEAILRPMLREWLDENLPTMVERLVREEIERVSRGV